MRRRNLTSRLLTIAVTLFVVPHVTRAADAFDRDIKPILTSACVDCHGGAKKKSGLDLTSVESIGRGSEAGPVVVPGKASQSLLLQVLKADADPHMPPKKQLSEEQIATIGKWVDGLHESAVARSPKNAGQPHWAYQKPKPVTPPAVKDAKWVRSPIDAFILAGLESKGLRPAPEATREALIRRATFDLIGLPPTPEDVAAFVADNSADAYEKLVDRLLASPRYGERWGRHWLDLARYADSGGFHNDLDRPNAWRYRDYVIASFNADKPYAQFVREQLAGDEISPDDPHALAATGFLRAGPSNEDNMGKGKEQEKYRLDELDDVIGTSGAVFMGLTIGCARCHDHKTDPIPQADYYRFLSVFNTTVRKELPLNADGTLAKRLADSTEPKTKEEKAAAAKEAGKSGVMIVTDSGPKPRATQLLWRGDLNNPGPEVQPGVPAVLTDKPIRFPDSTSRTTGRRTALADWIVSPENPLTWRVIANRLWQHHFGRGIVPTPSNFGVSGEPASNQPLLDWLAQETISRGGSLKSMHRLIMTSAAYRQSSRWNETAGQIDPNNALVWRMSKQRLEAEAVRDAILAVAGNLNTDVGGPGVKPRIPADMLESSQRNKWPLVTKEGPTHWRRSVYIYVKRQLQFPMLELFDSPAPSQSCGQRQWSVVPTQALVLMNDEFTTEQARYFAVRVIREAGDGPAKQADHAIRLAIGKSPTRARLEEAVQFVQQQRKAHETEGKPAAESAKLALADLCHVLINCNEFVYVD